MSKVDNELTRRLHRAERPVDTDALFEGLERRRSHRERVRRVEAVVLAVTVLAVTVGGFAVLSQAFREQPRRGGSAPPESPTDEPSGRDIGLGYPLCNIKKLGGINWYGDGTSGSAWTGVPLMDGGQCPSSPDAGYLVAVDLDGDGSAESAAEPLPGSCLLCRPFDTTDLNNDGVRELVVLDEASSTPSYSLYEVSVPTSERSPGVYPIFIEPPGAPRMNLDAGEPVRFMVGGDEGFSGSLLCEEGRGSPIIRYTWVQGAVDAHTDLDVDITRLKLQEDGSLRILTIDAFSVPRNAKIPDLISERPACGVDFHPAA